MLICVVFLVVKYLYDDHKRLQYITSRKDRKSGDNNEDIDLEYASTYLSKEQQSRSNSTSKAKAPNKVTKNPALAKEPSSKKVDSDVESNRFRQRDSENQSIERNLSKKNINVSYDGGRDKLKSSKSQRNMSVVSTDSSSEPRPSESSYNTYSLQRANSSKAIKPFDNTITKSRPKSVHLDDMDISRNVLAAKKRSMESSLKRSESMMSSSSKNSGKKKSKV